MNGDMTLDEAKVWGLSLQANLATGNAPAAINLLKYGFTPTRQNFRWVLTIVPALAADILRAQNPDGVFASPIFAEDPTDAERVAGQLASTAYNVDATMQQALITAFLDRFEGMEPTSAANLMFQVVMQLVGFLNDALHGRGQVPSP